MIGRHAQALVWRLLGSGLSVTGNAHINLYIYIKYHLISIQIACLPICMGPLPSEPPSPWSEEMLQNQSQNTASPPRCLPPTHIWKASLPFRCVSSVVLICYCHGGCAEVITGANETHQERVSHTETPQNGRCCTTSDVVERWKRTTENASTAYSPHLLS